MVWLCDFPGNSVSVFWVELENRIHRERCMKSWSDRWGFLKHETLRFDASSIPKANKPKNHRKWGKSSWGIGSWNPNILLGFSTIQTVVGDGISEPSRVNKQRTSKRGIVGVPGDVSLKDPSLVCEKGWKELQTATMQPGLFLCFYPYQSWNSWKNIQTSKTVLVFFSQQKSVGSKLESLKNGFSSWKPPVKTHPETWAPNSTRRLPRWHQLSRWRASPTLPWLGSELQNQIHRTL